MSVDMWQHLKGDYCNWGGNNSVSLNNYSFPHWNSRHIWFPRIECTSKRRWFSGPEGNDSSVLLNVCSPVDLENSSRMFCCTSFDLHNINNIGEVSLMQWYSTYLLLWAAYAAHKVLPGPQVENHSASHLPSPDKPLCPAPSAQRPLHRLGPGAESQAWGRDPDPGPDWMGPSGSWLSRACGL